MKNINQTQSNPLLTQINIENYFQTEIDKRQIKNSFNLEIFDNLKNLFEKEELKNIQKINKIYQEKIQKITPTILKKEIERLTIDLSWKSSQIEGNTYTLIDTELLIREQITAQGKKLEEAIMITNHKKTLDYIWSHKDYFRNLSLSKIEELHSLLINDLGVPKNIRQRLVRITGTNYTPLDNRFQIQESLEKLIQVINQTKNPLEKALIANLMISYIQPFEDGNKRTARILGNALLIAHEFCPLSFRSIDEVDYKKAIILFYEQNSALFFKELFLDQFKFAVENYF